MFCFKNIEESEKKCRDLIARRYKPISEAYERGDYAKPGGYKAYADAMQVLEKEYRKTKGKGPQVHVQFLSYNP